MVHLVFVYGTLKTGEPNIRYMTEEFKQGLCEFRGLAHTKEKFPLVVASRYNIPYLLYKPGTGHHVEGEVYAVDDIQLEYLDKLENHPRLYTRQPVTLTTKRDENEAMEEINAEAYFLVNYQPELLQLPTLETYKDLVNGKKYVLHKDREAKNPTWWFEIHSDYKEGDTEFRS
ncbi:hypothetical protein ACF0H5_011704 [Mactra antiquata]